MSIPGLSCPPDRRTIFSISMSRRTMIIGAGAAMIGATIPVYRGYAATDPASTPSRDGSVLDVLVPNIRPEIAIENTHTDERVDVTYYDRTLGYDHDALEQINWIFRDWRRDEEKATDPRLLWGLSAIAQASQQEGHSGVIRLNSGFRTPETNASLNGAVPNSLHIEARAADLTLEGIPVQQVSNYAEWLEVGGVGHYPNSFTHVDTGRRRRW